MCSVLKWIVFIMSIIVTEVGTFQVPAISVNGVPVTNKRSSAVEVTFSAQGLWTYQKGIEFFSPGGIPNYWLQSQLQYPELTAFSLVAVNKQTNQAMEIGSGKTLSIQPGEVWLFKMNDAVNGYGDNDGIITVKWSAPKENLSLLSGQFILLANEEKNLPSLTNNWDTTVKVKIKAEGAWNFGATSNNWINQLVDANGNFQTKYSSLLKFPELKPAALVAEIKDKLGMSKGAKSGKEQMIELQPGDTVFFIINDHPDYYGDNEGSQTIKFSVFS